MPIPCPYTHTPHISTVTTSCIVTNGHYTIVTYATDCGHIISTIYSVLIGVISRVTYTYHVTIRGVYVQTRTGEP